MTTPMDPSGLMISASVTTQDGGEYPLWMAGPHATEADPSIFFESNDFPDLPIVQSIEVEMTRGNVSTINIELGANYELGLALLRSELFVIGNTISVEFGYSRIGLFFPRFSGMATKPSISIAPDTGLSATLNVQAGMFASTRSLSPRNYENKSYQEIISEIANLKHNKWLVDFPSQNGEDDPLYVKHPAVQQTRSDWAAVMACCSNANCHVTIRPIANEGGNAHVVITRASEESQAQPIFTLMSRGQIDMINRFPILSIESEAEGVWLPAGSDRTRTADIRSEDRSIPEETSDQDTRQEAGEQPLAEGSVGDGAEEGEEVNIALRTAADEGDDRFVYSPDSATGTTPRDEVGAVNREEQGRGAGIQVNVSTIGNPKAFPSDLIRLEGVGLFDGNYTIDGLSHRVASGDWTTDYRLIRAQPFAARYIHRALSRSWDPNDQTPEELVGAGGGGNVELDPYSVEDL